MVFNLNKNKIEADKNKGKNQVSSVRRCVVKFMNAVSLLCTIAGASLLSAILYGQINIHDYRNIEMASNCAYGLLIAAVFLGLLALVFSFIKEDRQPIEPVTIARKLNHKAVQGNSNLNTASLQGDNIKVMACNDKRKQVCADAFSLTNKISSSSILQTTDASKKTQISKNINNSCTTAQYSDKAAVPLTEKQLVPATNNYSHLLNKNSNAVVQYPVRQRWNFIPNGNFPVTEVVTSRKVSYLANNLAQEEFYIKRTYLPPQGSKIPPCNSPVNFEEYFKKFQECQKNPVTDVTTNFESLNILH